MRYFLDISYLGTDFHGWQIQKNANSVQAEIEKALSLILRTKIGISGSGRTDTGVHAYQQIAHFDSTIPLNTDKITGKLNSLLPASIAIRCMLPVTAQAHARFDALIRSYVYRIHRSKDPFLDGFSYQFRPELNIEPIAHACERLTNWKDFQCFSRVKTDVKHFECTIHAAQWKSVENGFEFHITANRFLRGMVRAIVGTLLEVGQNKLSLSEFDLVLEGRNRSNAGAAAPPHGLYLSEVRYPDNIYQ